MGRGNLNFATAAMVKPYTPFYPAAWHDGPGKTFAVGLESANVVAEVFAQYHEPGPAESKLAEALTKYLLQAEAAAVRIAASSKWSYAGIDPTPAPLGEVSIGRAIENFIGAPFGSGGTMTAASIITRAVQSTPVKQVGYAGLMVPVLEDAVLAKRWEEGTYNMDSLLAYSAVCAGGLDTIPLPGDISEERLARIMGDVASLAWKWHKPLAARLLPAPGKKARRPHGVCRRPDGQHHRAVTFFNADSGCVSDRASCRWPARSRRSRASPRVSIPFRPRA